jgi:hypothetical protein
MLAISPYSGVCSSVRQAPHPTEAPVPRMLAAVMGLRIVCTARLKSWSLPLASTACRPAAGWQ